MLNTSSANFPEKLKKARIAAGLSQTTLAEAIGASSGSISNWETGLNVPRSETVEKLNKELFQDSGKQKSSTTLTIKSPASKKGSAANGAVTGSSKASLKDFETDELAKELKRRGYTVNLSL